MKTKRLVDNFSYKFKTIGEKVLSKITEKEYINTYGFYQPIVVKKEDKDLFISTSYFANISTRRTIVKTLDDIGFKRNKKDWTEKVAIAFMEEVFDLYLNEANDEVIETRRKEISTRYNVPTNRLKTQVALFLNNLDNGKDKFNILSYFSIYEIITWKYRDNEKLQNMIEENKIPESDLDILRKLERIV